MHNDNRIECKTIILYARLGCVREMRRRLTHGSGLRAVTTCDRTSITVYQYFCYLLRAAGLGRLSLIIGRPDTCKTSIAIGFAVIYFRLERD